ncbi:TPA: hypothetical protein RH941_000503 [Pseudomonas aeruginosa]|uniref:hypothetical protein n=1 Tax=Pseudomonas aeruginosa TaxID=287 RepID=UPI0020769086|nr:hypothetical protein [Pseudomonas aeruginosa]MCM8572384.1 hypothetical protein [Pseudomonas aeruginosa]HDV4106834.1 hypothetical protein [Pseudomonas aeruginosa]HDV4161285.1 hypothetical protein [Pseudomonas aeruginosa]HDV4174424.1 hypothetical protein [Pseudomonas aeruginosa]HDV4193053.1 hypothetical protein [Pseudomonas aeruginosa]
MPFTEIVQKFTRKELSADEAVAQLKEEGVLNIAFMMLLEEYLETRAVRDSYFPNDAER